MQLISLLPLLLWLLEASIAKRDFVIEITHFNFTLLRPTLFSHIDCQHYNDKAFAYLSGELELARDLPSFLMRASFDMVRKDNKRMNLLKLDLDVCAFFEGGYAAVSFARFGLLELRRTSNLPRSCPIKKSVKYFVRNYTINPEDYPAFTPAMNFIWTIQFLLNAVPQGDLMVQGKVRKI